KSGPGPEPLLLARASAHIKGPAQEPRHALPQSHGPRTRDPSRRAAGVRGRTFGGHTAFPRIRNGAAGRILPSAIALVLRPLLQRLLRPTSGRGHLHRARLPALAVVRCVLRRRLSRTLAARLSLRPLSGRDPTRMHAAHAAAF